MLTTRRVLMVLACAAALGCAGCGKVIATAMAARSQPSRKIGQGKLVGREYSHEYFGLKLSVPGNWSIAAQEVHDEVADQGASVISGSNAIMKSQFDAAKSRTHNLLMASRYPLGSPVSFNHNLIVEAEDVHLFPGITDGADYLSAAQKTLQQVNGVRISFGPIEKGAKLASHAAARVDSTITMGNTKAKQRMYAVRIKDYVLCLVLSYTSDAQLRELEQILAGMQLSN